MILISFDWFYYLLQLSFSIHPYSKPRNLCFSQKGVEIVFSHTNLNTIFEISGPCQKYILETRFFKDCFILLRQSRPGPERTCYSHLKFQTWWGPHSLKPNMPFFLPHSHSVYNLRGIQRAEPWESSFLSIFSSLHVNRLSLDRSSVFTIFFLSFQTFHCTPLLGGFSWATSSSSYFLLVWKSLGKSFNPPLHWSSSSS